MKNISKGEIYEFSGIYHLVLEEAVNTSRKMFFCSLAHEADMDKLLQVNDYGIVTPNEEWQYVRKISDNDYKKALENFRVCIGGQYKLEDEIPLQMSR